MDQQPLQQLFCPHCRGGNPPNASTCMWCGTALTSPVVPRKSRIPVWGWLLIAGFAGLLGCVVLFTVLGYLAPTKLTEPTNTADLTVEYQLASLDAGHTLSESDQSIGAYRNLLDHIQQRTGETRSHIADVIYNSQTQLQNFYGRKAKLLTLLQAGSDVVDADTNGLDFSVVMAGVVATLGSK